MVLVIVAQFVVHEDGRGHRFGHVELDATEPTLLDGRGVIGLELPDWRRGRT